MGGVAARIPSPPDTPESPGPLPVDESGPASPLAPCGPSTPASGPLGSGDPGPAGELPASASPSFDDAGEPADPESSGPPVRLALEAEGALRASLLGVSAAPPPPQ